MIDCPLESTCDLPMNSIKMRKIATVVLSCPVPLFWLSLCTVRLDQAFVVLLHSEVTLVRDVAGADDPEVVKLCRCRKVPIRPLRVLNLTKQGVRPERGAVVDAAAEVGAVDSFERLIQPELLVALVEVH